MNSLLKVFPQNVSKLNFKNYTYETLRLNILYFHLRPGTVISENQLAAELEISRSPVRDAISKLVNEGFLEVFPQRGSVVSHISKNRVQEIIFMRRTVEKKMLEEACDNISKEDIFLLEQSLQKQYQVLKQNQVSQVLDEEYHMYEILYKACGKEFIWNSYRFLIVDIIRINYLKLSTFHYKEPVLEVSAWDITLSYYRTLIDAIKNRDSYSACQAISQILYQIELDVDNMKNLYPQYFKLR